MLQMHFSQTETWRLRPVAFRAGAVAVELRFIRNAGGLASHGLRENVAALRIFSGGGQFAGGSTQLIRLVIFLLQWCERDNIL